MSVSGRRGYCTSPARTTEGKDTDRTRNHSIIASRVMAGTANIHEKKSTTRTKTGQMSMIFRAQTVSHLPVTPPSTVYQLTSSPPIPHQHKRETQATGSPIHQITASPRPASTNRRPHRVHPRGLTRSSWSSREQGKGLDAFSRLSAERKEGKLRCG